MIHRVGARKNKHIHQGSMTAVEGCPKSGHVSSRSTTLPLRLTHDTYSSSHLSVPFSNQPHVTENLAQAT